MRNAKSFCSGIIIILIVMVYTGCSRTISTRSEERIQFKNITVNNQISQNSTPILRIDSGGHMDKIKFIRFTNDGKKIISVSYDKTIRIWDISTGISKIIRGEIGQGKIGILYAAALSPNNQLLAISGYPAHYGIRVIDLIKRKIVHVLKQHTNVVLGLNFSSDNKRLISGSADHSAIIWNITTGHILHRLGSHDDSSKGHSKKIYAAAFSYNDQYAATASEDKTVILWNTLSGEKISVLSGHTEAVVSLAFTPDGKYLLSGGRDCTIRLWEMEKNLFSSSLVKLGFRDEKPGKFIKILSKQDCSVEDMSVSPNSKLVLTGKGYCEQSGGNNIYSIPDGEKQIAFNRHNNIVLSTDFSPDSNLAATAGGEDNEILIWDIKTSEILKELVGEGKRLWSVGFHKDGKSIAFGTTWGSNSLFNHGTLEQVFQIFEGKDSENKIAHSLELGADLRTIENYHEGIFLKENYIQSIKKVGNISIGTEGDESRGTEDDTINGEFYIKHNNKIIHRIKGHKSYAFDHRSLTLSPDGRLAISGGNAGQLKSYDTRTGKLFKSYVGHTGDVWAVSVSPKNNLLASVSADQTIRLWDLYSGKNLLNIFYTKNRDWVVWTTKGYYWSSLRGDKYIGWHINLGTGELSSFFKADRFEKKFRNKKVVLEYVKTGGNLSLALQKVNNKQPKKNRVENISVNNIKHFLPPKLSFIYPEMDQIEISDNKYCVKAEAHSRTSEDIEDIWLALNGRLTKGYELQKKMFGKKAEINQCFEFFDQKNIISLYAKTKANQSEPENIVINTNMEHRWYKHSDLYVLSIGVKEYNNSNYNLTVADNDATAIAELFKDQESIYYKNVYTKILINQDATRENIRLGLEWVKTNATQNDICVIFIAGHGINVNGLYYFLPHDFTGNAKISGIPSEEFTDIMTQLPARMIFWVDTCHSGNITRNWKSDITGSIRDLSSNQRGVVLMMASTGNEKSREDEEWGHGAFTKAIVEGMDQLRADEDKNNIINISELDNYVTRRVKDLTSGKQHPTTEIPISIVGDFVIIKKTK